MFLGFKLRIESLEVLSFGLGAGGRNRIAWASRLVGFLGVETVGCALRVWLTEGPG